MFGMVTMQCGAELADPLVDVRDVVESFRSFGVTPADWDLTLGNALTALDQLPPEETLNVILVDLVPRIRTLLITGLHNAPEVVDQVATQVAAVLDETRIPGIPRPEDEDWSFR